MIVLAETNRDHTIICGQLQSMILLYKTVFNSTLLRTICSPYIVSTAQHYLMADTAYLEVMLYNLSFPFGIAMWLKH